MALGAEGGLAGGAERDAVEAVEVGAEDGGRADDDAGGPDAGPDGTPPFPGQDFIDPALSLVGLTAVISVEPEDDDSPAPFAIKPLIDAMVEDVGAGVTQSMDDPGAIPDGMASIVME